MTRALLHFSLLLALLSSAVAGTAAELPAPLAAGSVAAWSPMADAAVLPGSPVAPAAVADTNIGPTGRLGPGSSVARLALHTTPDTAAASSLEAFVRARTACRGHCAADALTRAGIPFCHAAEPPPFHTV